MKRITKDIFIDRSKLRNGDKYSYDDVDYINSQTKVTLICKKNHVFQVRPDIHINRGDGCRICKNEKMVKKNKDFLDDLKYVFGDLYIYELVQYKGVYSKVKLVCKKHGEFSKSPNCLLKGRGCPKCNVNYKLDITRFINLASISHENRYDYSISEYVNSRSKVKILCKKHGIFEQLANNHLQGHGCKLCDRSKSEIYIENYLTSRDIKFKTEFKFKDLKDKYPLRFDFAIFNRNGLSYLIEFQGKQHYEYYPSFHKNEVDFINSLKRDKMKVDYCEYNNIKLYIIRYDDDLELSLEKIINENEKEDRI